jgi:hypothetical protein
MLTVLSEPTEEILQFRANPWSFQQTFKTPLKDLNRFVSTFLAPYSFERGALSTDLVVFEPKDVLNLVATHSVELENCYNFTLEAKGQREIAVLLEAVLGDWIDFVFVPSPELLAIYADHDEYTTFYFPNVGALKSLTSELETAGFEPVSSYKRTSSGNNWR